MKSRTDISEAWAPAWFTPDYGINPYGGLIADANGNLFGTAVSGNPYNNSGDVYEIQKTPR